MIFRKDYLFFILLWLVVATESRREKWNNDAVEIKMRQLGEPVVKDGDEEIVWEGGESGATSEFSKFYKSDWAFKKGVAEYWSSGEDALPAILWYKLPRLVQVVHVHFQLIQRLVNLQENGTEVQRVRFVEAPKVFALVGSNCTSRSSVWYNIGTFWTNYSNPKKLHTQVLNYRLLQTRCVGIKVYKIHNGNVASIKGLRMWTSDVGPYCCLNYGCKDYRGKKNTTATGKTCQNWADRSPHKPYYTPKKNPDDGLHENYCRNPHNTAPMAWCYTTDKRVKWEYCGIPHCSEGECCQPDKCKGYRGKMNTTKKNLKCRYWGSLSANTPYNPKRYPYDGLEENYCRNPSGHPNAWCYVPGGNGKWDDCDIPNCITDEKCCHSHNCWDYRGKQRLTVSGYDCQSWYRLNYWIFKAAEEGTAAIKNKFSHPNGGLDDHNYCRNPTGRAKYAWCYTTDKKQQWEYCPVPKCTAGTTCCFDDKCKDYMGKLDKTKDGETCADWKLQVKYTPKRYPHRGLIKNYCRNPTNEKTAWCYTGVDSWGTCNISKCDPDTRGTLSNFDFRWQTTLGVHRQRRKRQFSEEGDEK